MPNILIKIRNCIAYVNPNSVPSGAVLVGGTATNVGQSRGIICMALCAQRLLRRALWSGGFKRIYSSYYFRQIVTINPVSLRIYLANFLAPANGILTYHLQVTYLKNEVINYGKILY